ncbi:MAG: MBL fold metallo-hydrolase [Fimbriimonadaceae bacterium]
MILKRFYNESLAQASYMFGCPGSGEAIVIDPSRDVETYIGAAAAEGLRIVGVTETHIHADYASGSLELAERTGATLYLSDEGDADWKYAFADRPNVRLVKNGDSIRIGALRLDVLHTPGHTPEHISFVLTDEAAGPDPVCAFTGDFVFVGDVGRPDLLERAANFQGTMEKGARVLFHSIRKFLDFPDHMLIWPGHGAGSACGKSLGGVPVTSLGYEKATNWAFQVDSEDRFVEEVLTGQPDPPAYFKEMKRLNKQGAPMLGSVAAPPRLGGARFIQAVDAGQIVVDIRDSETVASGFVRGTLHIPLGKSFSTWAGWLLPYDQPFFLLAETREDAERARRELAMIGLDLVEGWFGTDVFSAYRQEVGELETFRQWQPQDLLRAVENGEVSVIDVRGANEPVSGRVPKAIHIPLGQLAKRLDEVPTDRPVVVYCAGGMRSAIAVSILKGHGFADVSNLAGGYDCFETACGNVGLAGASA